MYQIGICDDDKVFCDNLAHLVNMFSQQERLIINIEYFHSGEALIDYMEEHPPFHLLFLDIEFKGINGVGVGKTIRDRFKNEMTQIVFVSIKENYAMQLFRIRPLDFLIKPVCRESVFNVMSEYRRLFDGGNTFFNYHIGKSIYSLAEDEIRYLMCEGKKVKMVTNEGIKEFYDTMSNVEKRISNDKFYIVHKSYIVNVNYVKEFRPNEVIMVDGEKIPISQLYRKKIREKILEWSISTKR